MKRAGVGLALLMALGCGDGGAFEGGYCPGAGGHGVCQDGRHASCGEPVCDGDGWFVPSILCGDERPFCEDAAEETCWTEEEILERCGVD